jgi:TetR/AcrR family transcriptional regulator, cholesterol catabolism regulator
MEKQVRVKRKVATELKKSDATRQRILDAAALILSREGFAGTKLADIAAEAQLKVATLYYYYESREALVEAVMVTGSEHVRQHTMSALAALDRSCTPVDRLCTAVESHLRFVLEISNYTQAVIRNASQVPEHIRTTLRHEINQYGRLWQGLVNAAAEGTAFRTPAQRKALRLLILGGLNWTVEWWTEAQAPLDEVVLTAVTMTRASLRPA